MFQDLFTQNRQNWVVGGLVALIILTALNVIVSKSQLTYLSDISNKPQADSKTATLSLSTNTTSVQIGDKFTVQIVLDPNGASIDAADTMLTYDVAKLKAVSIQPGDMFATYPVNSILSNKVQLAGFALPVNNTRVETVTQKGILGTVTFTAQAPGIAKIEFDNENSVVASSAKDVLKSTTGAFITVR